MNRTTGWGAISPACFLNPYPPDPGGADAAAAMSNIL
jgi:hypothetical protein